MDVNLHQVVLFHEKVVVSGGENINDIFFSRMNDFLVRFAIIFHTCKMYLCVLQLQLPEVWDKY